MSLIGHTILSTLKLKCPRCHKGNLFINDRIYQYEGFFDMPNHCEKCEQDFQIEAGFYYGAMYISYGLTIAISVAVFVALTTFNLFEIGLFLIVDILTLLITLPYVFKLSRSIWISFIVKYDPNVIN